MSTSISISILSIAISISISNLYRISNIDYLISNIYISYLLSTIYYLISNIYISIYLSLSLSLSLSISMSISVSISISAHCLLVLQLTPPRFTTVTEGNGHLHFNDIWGVKLIGQGAELGN